ncbi:MAG TPA: outer membrane lipoprotein-sorting protein [Armatimonadota bacterium]|jgi:outer membrane lipoprotein-sorting protein
MIFTRTWRSFFVIAAVLITGSSAQADVREQVKAATHHFRDICVTCKVAYSNQRELQKIGKDFPKSYELKSSTAQYKYPDKMRVEGKLGLLKVVMLINGDMKLFVIPTVRYRDKENIKGKPHKRQTELDLGIVTESLWSDYIVTQVEDLGAEYKIVFVRSNSKNKNLVCWLDSKTLRMMKLEKFENDGGLKSRYIYSNHKEYQGIWVPGRIDVYNEDGKLAATTVYEKVSVNSGIPDSVFNIN